MEKAKFDPDIVLRDVTADDLPFFFEQQRDPEANYMAAFTAKDPEDRAAFMQHWAKILSDETITAKTILSGRRVIGNVSSYQDEDGRTEVTYWIAKPYWGQGIATRALSALLEHNTVRPLYARAVKDNAGSLRVLAKCGFVRIGEGTGFANGRGKEVEEFILRLD